MKRLLFSPRMMSLSLLLSSSLLLLPCLLVVKAEAEPEPARVEDDAEVQRKERLAHALKEREQWTTPELCAKHDADSLYGRYIKSAGFALDSEIWRDDFYEAHREVLEKRTNELHPEGEKFREPLMEVFKTTLGFIRGANGGLGGHLAARLPAEVEWDINEGFQSKFALGELGKFTHQDIRELALMFQRTRVKYTLHMDASVRDPKAFEPVLEDLKKAEASMSKEATLYFRATLVAMIAGYMGSE
jgi:hypothetical protein